MKPHWQSFWLPGSLSLLWLATTSPMQAQIVQDATLPNPSIVTLNGNTSIITEGTQAGPNLFHSFREFSVPTGGASFRGIDQGIENVISRVTGSSVSNINGLIEVLQANGAVSSANFFLLNPNGIIFGPNASLNIGGSIIASTASSLNFTDGTSFSATNSQTTEPLLTVSTPIGLQFGRPGGSIQVQGARLQVPKTLGLVGSDLTLVGGRLTAAGGRIELGSVAGAVTPNLAPVQIGFTPVDQGWALGYKDIQNFQDIQLSQQATVDTSGERGGDIQVQGRRVTLTGGSQMVANTQGTEPGGTLAVAASESVELSGSSASSLRSALFARVEAGATGAGGNLTIETGRLTVQGGAQVSTSTFGQGQAGDLTVRAIDLVEVSGRSEDRNIGSGLRATVQDEAPGAGGNLTIETGRLTVQGGAQVSTSTFGQGQAGNLTVQATEVELIGYDTSSGGRVIPSSLFANAETGATGTGGNLTIETDRLSVQSGAQVSVTTSSEFSQANAGILTVRASDVELVGDAIAADGQLLTNEIGLPFPSGLFAGTGIGSNAAGGTLTVETDRLVLRDGAVVQTSTLGAGDAGDLTVQASESVELIGTADGRFPTSLLGVSGGIPGFPGVVEATGQGGNIDLEVGTGQLLVEDGAAVAASSLNPNNNARGAGNIDITAQTLRLDNQGAIAAETASGNGGNITLQNLDLLLLRRNSNISTTAGTAQAGGTGGNIDINNAQFIVAIPSENSDIKANAFLGQGGKVTINAQSIFGLAERNLEDLQTLLGNEDPILLDPINLASSDITAISQTDPSLSGQVTINTPDVDPSRGLVTLPTDFVDASGLIAQNCPTGGGTTASELSEFIVTGRGGLPPSPNDALSSQVVWQDLRPPARQVENRSSAAPSANPRRESAPTQIVEAQGWIIGANGEVLLTATAPTVNLHIPWLPSAECHAPEPSS
jgi:filamentous hemagglutinin family protein